jgi:hypothetical protein
MIKNHILKLFSVLILIAICCLFLEKNLLSFSESIRPKSGQNAQNMKSKALADMNNRGPNEKRHEAFIPEHDILIKLTPENTPNLLWIWFLGILFTAFTMKLGKMIIKFIENVIVLKSAAKLPPSG